MAETSSSGKSDAAAALAQLQLEHALLLEENAFLKKELAACPDVSARVTTARETHATQECRLLRTYVEALRLEQPQRCREIHAELAQRREEALHDAVMLEELLLHVRAEVERVTRQCGCQPIKKGGA